MVDMFGSFLLDKSSNMGDRWHPSLVSMWNDEVMLTSSYGHPWTLGPRSHGIVTLKQGPKFILTNGYMVDDSHGHMIGLSRFTDVDIGPWLDPMIHGDVELI